MLFKILIQGTKGIFLRIMILIFPACFYATPIYFMIRIQLQPLNTLVTRSYRLIERIDQIKKAPYIKLYYIHI